MFSKHLLPGSDMWLIILPEKVSTAPESNDDNFPSLIQWNSGIAFGASRLIQYVVI